MPDRKHEPIHHPPAGPLPYTPDRAPLTAALVDTARVFSVYGFPVSDAVVLKGPYKTFLQNGKRSAEVAVVWGWLLSQMQPEHSREVRTLFTGLRMRRAVAEAEEHYRKNQKASLRGAHFRRTDPDDGPRTAA